MQVQLGPLVSNAAGSFGGLTIQRDPLGHVVRSRPNPIRRRTQHTNSNRSPFAALGQVWRELSPSRRAEWQALADLMPWSNRFGDPLRGLGYWAFLHCNRYRLQIGEGIIESAPEYETPALVTGLSLAANYTSGEVVLTWSSGPVPEPERWLLSASPVLPPGTTNPRNTLRRVGFLSETTSSGENIYSLQAERLFNRYGAGGQLFVEVQPVLIEKGFAGPTYQVYATTT